MTSIDIEILNEIRNANQHDDNIMLQVKSLLNSQDMKLLDDIISDSRSCYQFTIEQIEVICGEPLDETVTSFGQPVYLNEIITGGITGDEYAGDIYFPLSQQKVVKFSYAM